MRLTDQDYWERVHAGTGGSVVVRSAGRRHPFKRWVRRAAGDTLWAWTLPYDDYLLWEVILPRYLRDAHGRKAVEIGSAPGRFMIRLADTFGVVPYGIEYTASGASANRATFAAAGYDRAGVIEADVFSPLLQSNYAEYFDVVVSRGFVEHFNDPGPVLEAHRALLKPGGLLIVMIPNLRGVYYAWTWLFNRPQIAMHNLSLMRLARFRALFDVRDLSHLHCGYHGTFSFWLFTARPPARVMRHVVRLLITAQRGLNVLFRLVLRRRGAESAWLSPNLLYVGRKDAA